MIWFDIIPDDVSMHKIFVQCYNIYCHLFIVQVEAAQDFHFKKLFLILQKLGCEWAAGPHSNFHIRFGRIHGMSTRKGKIVLLKELLDAARDTMLENMQNTESKLNLRHYSYYSCWDSSYHQSLLSQFSLPVSIKVVTLI